MSFKTSTKNTRNTGRRFLHKLLATTLISILLVATVIPPVLSEPRDSWWNLEWTYRKPISLNTTKISGTLNNFPVLVQLTDSDLAAHAQPNGNDIVFINYNDNITQFNHEIEHYINGSLTAWVNITRISNTTDTKIWMYYGNPTCPSQQNIPGTWDSTYVMVHHLNETTDTLYDSTMHNNNGLSTGTIPTNAGKIDGARQYNSNDKIVINNITHSPNALTLETWVYRDNTDYIYIACKGIFSQTSTDWILYLRNNQPANQGIDFSINNHTSFIRKGDTPVGCWFHLSATLTNGTARLYLNGTRIGCGSGWPAISNCYPHLGLGNDYLGNEGSTYPMTDVRLDEVRLSTIARNSSWITTSYNNQKDPAGFCSIGDQEHTPSAENYPPIFGTPNPINGSTTVPLDLTWSIPINDPEGDLFSWMIECNNGQTNSITNASNGTKTLALSGLAFNTSYTVWVNATDSSGSGLYTRGWYSFTTQEEPLNNPPVFGTPSPVNASTGNPVNLSWSIPINDPEADLFSWTIQSSNGQTNSMTNATNGTKTLTLTDLTYNTTYTIWVNATDPTGSGLYTRKWYIFTTIQEPQLSIIITKPIENRFYFNDIEQSITLPRNTVVYGPITITAEVSSDASIKNVEFYADGKLLGNVNTTPYEWNWKPIIQFNNMSLSRTIKVIVYDTEGRTASDEINITKWRFHILPWLVIGASFASRLILHTTVVGVFYNIQESPFSVSFFALKAYYKTTGLFQRGRGNINFKHCIGGRLIGPITLTKLGLSHKLAIGSFTFIGTPTIERIGLLQALQNRRSYQT